MNELEANNEMMGSVAISRNGKLVYQKQIGFAQVTGNVKNSANTLFKVASNTKTFTAVMIFQLIEKGKLRLSSKLSEFYPKVKNAEKITISEMMYHRTGIFDMTADENFENYRVSGLTSNQQLEKIYAFPSVFEPGSQYKYSNTNYILLSFIIEKLTRKSYGQVLKEQITSKINLKNTFYGAEGQVDRLASGYSYENGWQAIEPTFIELPRGAGAIISTSADMNTFLRALAKGELISTESFAQMTQFKETRGRGIDMIEIPGAPQISDGLTHGGQIDGFLSQPIYFHEQDIALTFIANGFNTSPMKALAILKTYLANPF